MSPELLKMQFKRYKHSTWSDSENKEVKAWSWFLLTLKCCSKIWAFSSQEFGALSFPHNVTSLELKKKPMLPRATKTKRQKKRSFLLHFLTELGPWKGSVAFFNLEQVDNLPLKPESLQFRDILTKTHLCIFTKSLESLRKPPAPAEQVIKIKPSVKIPQESYNLLKIH